ncbi:MAG: PhoH family protein [Christensenellales bacterium]|jgi:phosphate starvation-inducible PhoH-like protein
MIIYTQLGCATPNAKEELTSLPLQIRTMDTCQAMFGMNDQNIRVLEDELRVTIHMHNGQLVAHGDAANVHMAEDILDKLQNLLERGEQVDIGRMRYYVRLAQAGQLEQAEEIINDTVAYTYRGRPVRCKTGGQKAYVDAIRNNQLTIAVGPAGTGKTFLAIALAVAAYRNKMVERLVLTRPAVEAGEKLGFLPGDMAQKVDPYLRPLYDALHEMMGTDGVQTMFDMGAIEIAPLAFMRGRTLNDAFIILDEAQNTTPEQMKMFLTRMGRNAKCVVTGDMTQIDLPPQRRSGLWMAQEVLSGIPGVQVMELDKYDVVRNDLVQRIVAAYEAYENGESHNE